MEERFDEEFAEIEIPDEVEDEIDNDWVLKADEWEALLNQYTAAKGEGQWTNYFKFVTVT